MTVYIAQTGPFPYYHLRLYELNLAGSEKGVMGVKRVDASDYKETNTSTY